MCCTYDIYGAVEIQIKVRVVRDNYIFLVLFLAANFNSVMTTNLFMRRMTEFNATEEDIKAYLLRLKHFFKANGVKDDNKVSV